MYKEHRIRTFKELKEYIMALDEDEGIRIIGRVNGFLKGGFIFVGIYMERYCVRICDRIWNDERKAYTVGQRDRYHYFHNLEDLMFFLEKSVERPLIAWFY